MCSNTLWHLGVNEAGLHSRTGRPDQAGRLHVDRLLGEQVLVRRLHAECVGEPESAGCWVECGVFSAGRSVALVLKSIIEMLRVCVVMQPCGVDGCPSAAAGHGYLNRGTCSFTPIFTPIR